MIVTNLALVELLQNPNKCFLCEKDLYSITTRVICGVSLCRDCGDSEIEHVNRIVQTHFKFLKSRLRIEKQREENNALSSIG